MLLQTILIHNKLHQLSVGRPSSQERRRKLKMPTKQVLQLQVATHPQTSAWHPAKEVRVALDLGREICRLRSCDFDEDYRDFFTSSCNQNLANLSMNFWERSRPRMSKDGQTSSMLHKTSRKSYYWQSRLSSVGTRWSCLRSSAGGRTWRTCLNCRGKLERTSLPIMLNIDGTIRHQKRWTIRESGIVALDQIVTLSHEVTIASTQVSLSWSSSTVIVSPMSQVSTESITGEYYSSLVMETVSSPLAKAKERTTSQPMIMPSSHWGTISSA